MEKISSTDRVRNKEVLQRVKEERNILRIVKRRKVIEIGHILRGLPSKIEVEIEGREEGYK
jgi:hypothetical protein